MSDQLVRCVDVLLDKPRRLRFDFNAARLFEEISGKNMFRNNVLSNLSATDTLYLVWACLRHEDKDLTVETVGEHMHLGNLEYLTDKIGEMISGNTPQPTGKERPTPGATA